MYRLGKWRANEQRDSIGAGWREHHEEEAVDSAETEDEFCAKFRALILKIEVGGNNGNKTSLKQLEHARCNFHPKIIRLLVPQALLSSTVTPPSFPPAGYPLRGVLVTKFVLFQR